MSFIEELTARYTPDFVSQKTNKIVVDSIVRQMEEIEFIKGEMTFTKGQMKDAVPELAALYLDTYQKLYRSFLSGNEMLSKYLATLDKRYSLENENTPISFDNVFSSHPIGE